MKQILVRLDDRTASQLEALVPRAKDRSELIRQAITRALLDVTEVRTREGYLRFPDDPAPFDPAAWANAREALHQPRRRLGP